jgi:LmbE family N-acetylglucosaminyl deacetylase
VKARIEETRFPSGMKMTDERKFKDESMQMYLDWRSSMESLIKKASSGPRDFFDRKMIEFDPNSKALILASHPDDDVIGCGGTIRKLIAQGSKVKSVYMTDGRFGSTDISPDKLSIIRHDEAIEALKVLGCEDYIFLKNADMSLSCTETNIEEIANIIKTFHPSTIFVPSLFEFHPDHINTTMLASAALNLVPIDVEVYFYEVWMPILPNALVDISEVAELKLKSIEKHVSQVTMNDYGRKTLGLNAYRSMLAPKGVQYCEAFMRYDRASFLEEIRNKATSTKPI